MKFKSFAIAALAVIAGLAGPMASSNASDLIFDNPVLTQSVNFNGPYAGVGVVRSNSGANAPIVSGGYDHRQNFFLVGVEVFSTVESTPVFGVDVKAGVVVTDDLTLYGIAGVQRDTGKAKDGNSFGVGTDLALADGIALTGSYKQVYDLGTFNNRDDQFRVGLKFSF